MSGQLFKPRANSQTLLYLTGFQNKLSTCLPAVRVLRHGIKASNKACGQMLPTLLETLPGRFQQVCQAAKTHQIQYRGMVLPSRAVLCQ